MNPFLPEFVPRTARMIRESITEIAPRIWGDHCRFDDVIITLGNYAGYGGYGARCHRLDIDCGEPLIKSLIEFPIGNSFSRIRLDREAGQFYAPDLKAAQGLLLHELGHHAVNVIRYYGLPQPWGDLKAGSSTHTEPAWCWIAATGWKHFFPEWIGTPEELARMVRRREGDIADKLAGFLPNYPPPEIIATDNTRACVQCGALFQPKRSDAKFCSTRCRVSASRSQCGATKRNKGQKVKPQKEHQQ